MNSVAPTSAEREILPLTQVELIWVESKIEYWLRFGRPVEKKILDRQRSVASFRPDAVFGFVRWASNDYGTIISQFDIVRTVASGACFQTLPCVRPGGEILLRTHGWPVVERILQRIDRIEALRIDPADVAPDYWRQLHNRLAAGHEPRPYTVEQHRAWLKRRRVTS